MAEQKTVQLNLIIKEAGAAEAAAEVKKLGTTTVSLQQELGKLSRTDQLQKLGADMGALAKKTGDVGAAVTDLTKKLNALGATEDEIKGVATAFNEAQSAGDGGGGNLLQKAGTSLRGLPSVQIPGTGIGTDAIGNITRLTGALGEASGATAAMASVTTALTPVLGATAAGFAGVLAVAGPLVLIVGALGLAIKAFADQAAAEQKAINATVDAQRQVNEEIAKGLTSEEANKKLEETTRLRKEEADLLEKNQRIYNENIENQGPLTAVLKATSGAEEALTQQIQKSKDLIEGYDTTQQSLTQALNDGSLAANDAAEAEKKLAEERTKQVLSDADTAGKELAAQQKALAATEEQNQKRLTSIEDEKAVIQKQIDVLTESGDTSEEVTKKIAALNGQLGSLGKESDFIKNTALEVSRQRDAEKKAQKDAEEAAKKAEQAQAQYTKSVENAQRTYKNAVTDIGTRLRQQLTDNTTKLNRDLTDIATKYRRDEFDLEIKANRAERDAQVTQLEDLAQIRENANKEEQAAIQAGDFKALFLARQKAAEDLKQETTTIDKSAAKRRQDYADAREDLLRNAQRQRQDRLTGYERQNNDARQAQERDLQQAALARQRTIAVAAQGLNAELSQYQNFWKQFNAVGAAGMKQALDMAAGQNPNALKKSPFQGFQGTFTAGGLGRIIKK